jgi:hypothetical protein
LKQSTLIVVESPYTHIPSNTKAVGDTPSANHIIHEDAPAHSKEVSLAKMYSLKGDHNDRLRLMHHYGMSTSYSISDLSSVRDTVPALAREFDFLLSGMFAVTSLHLALHNPSTIHTQSAVKHLSEALTLVGPHLTSMTPDNIAALFSFACLIASYSFGFHHTQPPCLDPLGEMFEVFTLIRGIGVIVKEGAQWHMTGPFTNSMFLTLSNLIGKLVSKIEAAISVLSQRNSDLITDSTQDAYAGSIDLLRQTFLLAAEKPSLKMTLLVFPIKVADEFVEKLRERDPLALVILANYAVVLYWLRSSIWIGGWGKEIVDAVKHAVDAEWHKYFKWAIEEVETLDA